MRVPILAGIICLALSVAAYGGEAEGGFPPAPPVEKADQAEKTAPEKPSDGETRVDSDGTIHWAPSIPGSRTGKPRSRRSMTSVIGSITFWLIILVVLIVGLTWVMKRFFGSSRLAGTSKIGRVLGRSHVGPKHQIIYLHVGNRVLVVGLSGDRMTTLSEITEQPDIEAMVGSSSPAQPGAIEKTFRRFFKRESTELNEPAKKPELPELSTDEARREIERVRKMVNTWRSPLEGKGESA